MKRILLIAVLLGAMFSLSAYFVCVAMPLMDRNIKGSGNIVTNTIPAPDFNAIDASRAVRVVISDKASDIRIEADDNLIGLVVAKPIKGTLVVTLDKSAKNISNHHVTVTVPANGKIRALDASSASSITSDATLRADKFTLSASSAAKINVPVEATDCSIETSSASKVTASLKATKCSVEASSASKITLSGSAENLQAELSSASKLNAAEFSVVNASIESSSGSNASIHCTGMLTTDASSGSSIRYTGDCRTALSKSSGASVRKN